MFSDNYLQQYGNNLIPDMTSNTTPSGEAFTNNVHSGSLYYDAWRAFSDIDKEKSGVQSSWCTDGYKGFIGYDFKKNVIINTYSIQCTTVQASDTCFPLNWTFEGFNNNSNEWVVLDKIDGFNEWGKYNDKELFFYCKNNKKYEKYRLNIESNYNAPWIQIKRIKMYCDKSRLYKILLKQNDKYYSIKLQFYNDEEYKNINLNNSPTIKDFENYGFDELQDLFKEYNSKSIELKGNDLEEGNVFSLKLNDDFEKISDVK